MARPSRNIDQVLMDSGAALYPLHGCSGLSLRMLAAHAGVNAGMFHYHFQSKDNFLRQLFQRQYDSMFLQLQLAAEVPGSARERLEHVMVLLGQFMREHGAWVSRLWADANSGQPVAREFMQSNAPRHMRLIMELCDAATREGALSAMPPLQRFTFLMGSVLVPMVIAPAAGAMGVLPAPLAQQLDAQILSNDAITERVQRTLCALSASLPPTEKVQA